MHGWSNNDTNFNIYISVHYSYVVRYVNIAEITESQAFKPEDKINSLMYSYRTIDSKSY